MYFYIHHEHYFNITNRPQVTFRNIEFSDSIQCPGIKKQTKGNTKFRKLDLFPSSGAERKTYSVGSLRKS
jgi:hypothetical protein